MKGGEIISPRAGIHLWLISTSLTLDFPILCVHVIASKAATGPLGGHCTLLGAVLGGTVVPLSVPGGCGAPCLMRDLRGVLV